MYDKTHYNIVISLQLINLNEKKSIYIESDENSGKIVLTYILQPTILQQWPSGKASAHNAWDIRDAGSVPRLGRSPGGGNGNPLQYSYLKNPMDRGAWWATVYAGRNESDTTERLSRDTAAGKRLFSIAGQLHLDRICCLLAEFTRHWRK